MSTLTEVPGSRGNVDAVERAIAQMRDDLGAPLRLVDLARTASFSPFHFHRVFRAVTGETPARFLAALRMAEARRLLARTRSSVAMISLGVGYTSVGTFSTQFRRLVGLPPERFRQLAHRLNGLLIGGRHLGTDAQPAIAKRWGLDDAGRMIGEFRPLGPDDGQALWGTADADCRIWRLPSGLAPGIYQVRILHLAPRWPAMSALIDNAQGSYRVGAARLVLALPTRFPALLPVPLRSPVATDRPVLSADPVRLLTEALQAEMSGQRVLHLA